MRRVVERNIEAKEQVLQIILGRKMKVKSIKGQYEICNALVKGRSITLDIHAVDEDEKQIDIEVQNGYAGPTSAVQDIIAVCWTRECWKLSRTLKN